MTVRIYSFYNNKGGVGKTTLCQNAASIYADRNTNKQVVVIDLCPQANISQFCLSEFATNHFGLLIRVFDL